MSDTVTLQALTEALVWESGIDGKTGSNARHVTARLYELINRQYKQLRSLVTQHGDDFFRVPGTATALPGRLTGEDYILVPWPLTASEIIAVDVRTEGAWRALTRSSRAQWRVDPGAHRPDSPGEWSVVNMPTGSTSGPDIWTPSRDGSIAIWPPSIQGDYAIDYVPAWVPITDPAGLFVLFPHWEEWLLCSCTMVVTQRDNNKRNMFQAARDRKAEAQAQIIAHARRSRRGVVQQRRRDGLEL